MIEIIIGIVILIAVTACMFSIKTRMDLEKSKKQLADTLCLFRNYTKDTKCGTVLTKLPFSVEIPEGYEMPKFNSKTGHAEYSDGTIAEHLELRKIQ